MFAEEGVVDGCRRFTARRVDCVFTNFGCATVLSFTLRRTGVVWYRPYGCTDPEDAFREQPAYTGLDRPVPLIN